MGKTSSEVKARWIKENYIRYHISLRKDEDKQLIAYIEKQKSRQGVTDIVREALEFYISNKN